MKTECKKCGQSIEYDGEYADVNIDCPECNESVYLPATPKVQPNSVPSSTVAVTPPRRRKTLLVAAMVGIAIIVSIVGYKKNQERLANELEAEKQVGTRFQQLYSELESLADDGMVAQSLLFKAKMLKVKGDMLQFSDNKAEDRRELLQEAEQLKVEAENIPLRKLEIFNEITALQTLPAWQRLTNKEHLQNVKLKNAGGY